MLQENVLWQQLSPCVSALVICGKLLYMYKSLMYVLKEVMKHNLDIFSTKKNSQKACDLNSFRVIS